MDMASCQACGADKWTVAESHGVLEKWRCDVCGSTIDVHVELVLRESDLPRSRGPVFFVSGRWLSVPTLERVAAVKRMYPALANEELIKHARLGSTFRLGTYGEADLPGLTDRLREHGVGLEATPREKRLSLPQDIASLLAPPGGNASALLQPSALETGESIRFLLESTGCFHHQAWVLEWSSAKAPTIDIWNVEWDKAGHLVHTYAGMTTIADSEARGLDALMALYRLMKDKDAGRCTTRERIFVEYYRDGKKIGHEEFDDMVCHILLDAPDGWDLEKHLPAYLPSSLVRQAVSLRRIVERASAK